jgi:hypothetical protein
MIGLPGMAGSFQFRGEVTVAIGRHFTINAAKCVMVKRVAKKDHLLITLLS